MILGQFPGVGAAAPPPENASPDEMVRQAAERLGSVFTFVVDDVVSYQKDPDYDRAEYNRQAVSIYAISILPEFQNFANEMRGRLDQATKDYQNETVPEP